MTRALPIAVVAILFGTLAGAGYSWWGNGVHVHATVTPARVTNLLHTDAVTAQPTPGSQAAAELPSLDSSDAPIRAAAVGLAGEDTITNLLTVDEIIRHVVATVDALPRHRFPVDAWPLRAPQGGFIAISDDQKSPLSEDNHARYAPYVSLLGRLDAQRLAQVYAMYRPLLQQAYVEQAGAQSSFDARLKVAIDDLLAAPDVTTPILVERPDAQYIFSDPALEALSSGQKLLLRMGPQNAAVIKGKLRELRSALN